MRFSFSLVNTKQLGKTALDMVETNHPDLECAHDPGTSLGDTSTVFYMSNKCDYHEIMEFNLHQLILRQD